MVYSVSDYKKFAAIIDYLATNLIGYKVEDDNSINILESLDHYEIRKIEEIIDGRSSD